MSTPKRLSWPVPPPPTSIADLGLPFSFICDLLLKILYFNGNVLGRELSELACLPWPVISSGITFLTKENFCGTTGARAASKAHEEFAEGLEYVLTTSGRERARETLELSQYAGPAPVPLARLPQECHRVAGPERQPSAPE